jgi:TPR repeat protein
MMKSTAVSGAQPGRGPSDRRFLLPITFLVIVLGWTSFVVYDRVRLERACWRGDGEACGTLGDVFLTGRISAGVWKDKTRAETFYRRGCAAADIPSCEALITSLHITDPEVSRSIGDAFVENSHRNAEAECRSKRTASCLWLGDMYAAKQDFSNAGRLYKSACDLGSTEGCKKLGDLKRQ